MPSEYNPVVEEILALLLKDPHYLDADTIEATARLIAQDTPHHQRLVLLALKTLVKNGYIVDHGDFRTVHIRPHRANQPGTQQQPPGSGAKKVSEPSKHNASKPPIHRRMDR
jgi:hypothetical protein